LRKIFFSSKWSYGFLSNASTGYKFILNVLREKVKLFKTLNSFKTKVKNLVDYYPFLPHFGFIGDHRTNYWGVNEFHKVKAPTVSVLDNFSIKSLLSMYGIPGNACSIDTSIFF